MNVTAPASGDLKKAKTFRFPQPLFLTLFIVLINLPPISIYGKALSLNTISKILLIISLVIFTIDKQFNYKYLHNIKPTTGQHLLLLIILSQSLSIIYSKDILEFLVIYQNTIFTFLFIYLFNNLSRDNSLSTFIGFFIISGCINAFFELILFFNPVLVKNLLSNILDKDFFNYLIFNYYRGRIYYESFAVIFIPLIFTFLLKKNKNKIIKVFYLIVLFAITMNSVIANNRSFFIMYLFSIFCSIFFIANLRKKIKQIIIIIFLILIIILLTLKLSSHTFGFNIIDRFTLTDKNSNYYSIISRFNLWEIAFQLGKGFLLTGVGLGNFFSYIPTTMKFKSIKMDKILKKGVGSSYQYVHNVFLSTFAETGVIGLIIMITIVFGFFIKDIVILFNKRRSELKALIICFWTLFLFSLFNPAFSFRYTIFYWFIRTAIEKMNKKNYY